MRRPARRACLATVLVACGAASCAPADDVAGRILRRKDERPAEGSEPRTPGPPPAQGTSDDTKGEPPRPPWPPPPEPSEPPTPLSSADCAPDARFVYAFSRAGNLYRVDADGSGLERLALPPCLRGAVPRAFAVARDGSLVLLQEGANPLRMNRAAGTCEALAWPPEIDLPGARASVGFVRVGGVRDLLHVIVQRRVYEFAWPFEPTLHERGPLALDVSGWMGTADGRVYGRFLVGDGSVGIATFDPGTLLLRGRQTFVLPDGDDATSAPVAFWGNQFFVFTTRVYRVDPTTSEVRVVASLPPGLLDTFTVAASSTCAPTER